MVIPTPRHKVAVIQQCLSWVVKTPADEEEVERGEGWYDIHVQGRPQRDGTGNANHLSAGVYGQGN